VDSPGLNKSLDILFDPFDTPVVDTANTSRLDNRLPLVRSRWLTYAVVSDRLFVVSTRQVPDPRLVPFALRPFESGRVI